MAYEIAKATAFIKKDMAIAVSYKLQFLFQFLQIFFSVAVIYFVGKLISPDSIILRTYNTDYFSFALVGLAISSYLKAGLVNTTNDIRQMMNQGILEAICASPTSYSNLLLFSSLWQFVFETFRVLFCFVVGFALLGLRLENANWFSAIVTLMLTIPIFLLLGMISSSILVLVKRGDPINWIFTSVATLVAGTMFPVEVLPPWLRYVAACIPLTYSLDAIRRSVFMNASLTDISRQLMVLAIFIVVLIPLALITVKVCISAAKRRGAFLTH
jgi:ABC-2 type transport system permease protein